MIAPFFVPETKSHLRLGQIYREHGVRGYCKFYTYSGSDENLVKKREYIIQQVGGEELKTSLVDVIPCQKYFLVLFDIFSNPEELKLWRKAVLWMDKKELKRKRGEMYDFEWEGISVIDEAGTKIGIIQSVVHMPTQQFVVKRDADSVDDFLIPYITDWIVKFDKKKKQVVMRLPEGLLSF